MERVLIISYIISMILTAGFIYCIYREKYWVFEFVNRIKKPIQQLVYVFLMLLSSYAYICFSLLIKADFNAVQKKLEGVASELGVQITIQREDVFQFMYKI